MTDATRNGDTERACCYVENDERCGQTPVGTVLVGGFKQPLCREHMAPSYHSRRRRDALEWNELERPNRCRSISERGSQCIHDTEHDGIHHAVGESWEDGPDEWTESNDEALLSRGNRGELL